MIELVCSSETLVTTLKAIYCAMTHRPEPNIVTVTKTPNVVLCSLITCTMHDIRLPFLYRRAYVVQ
jgi:hypothetical protein